MRESASRGFMVGSIAPYGYRRVKVQDGRSERRTLAPDPDQAIVVRRIFEMALQGLGAVEIARMLNAEGIASPRSKGWGKSSVLKVLTNEAYVGTLVWGVTSKMFKKPEPIRVENTWEPLVDRATFKAAQDALAERAPKVMHPRTVSSRYLLSGLLRCGACGKILTGQEAKSGKFAYYVCTTLKRKGRGTCGAPYLNAEKLDRFILGRIRERILTEENLSDLARLVNEEADALASQHREQLDILEAQLADVNRRLERLYESLETGKLSLDDLSPRIQHLRHRQDQLRAARQDAQIALENRVQYVSSIQDVLPYLDDMRSLLSEGSRAEQKAFIRSFVQEMVVEGHSAVIKYTVPLPPKNILEEREPVLAFEHDGGQ